LDRFHQLAVKPFGPVVNIIFLTLTFSMCV
jgi:hypothetical protein